MFQREVRVFFLIIIMLNDNFSYEVNKVLNSFEFHSGMLLIYLLSTRMNSLWQKYVHVNVYKICKFVRLCVATIL